MLGRLRTTPEGPQELVETWISGRVELQLAAPGRGDHRRGQIGEWTHEHVRHPLGEHTQSGHVPGRQIRPVRDPDRPMFQRVDRMLIFYRRAIEAAVLQDWR